MSRYDMENLHVLKRTRSTAAFQVILKYFCTKEQVMHGISCWDVCVHGTFLYSIKLHSRVCLVEYTIFLLLKLDSYTYIQGLKYTQCNKPESIE